MSALVLVVGEGLLADYTCRQLSNQFQVVQKPDFKEGVSKSIDLVLVLDDAWYPSKHQHAEKIMQPTGIPWIRGFVSFGEGIIGPLVKGSSPGCSNCADIRRIMAGRERTEMFDVRNKLKERKEEYSDAWATNSGLLQMSFLVAEAVQKVLQGQQSNLQEGILLINLKTHNSSRHSFLPDPLCSICGNLPDDTSKDALISLKPSLKISMDHYRCRPMDDLIKVLTKDYLDQKTGFMNSKMKDLVPPFADVVVNLPLLVGDEGVAGRTHSYIISESTAILEGLERYCGLAAHGKRTVVYDSYRNLESNALNPVKVGVHTQEQYAQPGFPFQPFNPDRLMNWVWGYSFLDERPTLVPELLAYYSLGCGDGFVYETSNGCALGGSLEEAIFHGIMEVVERDSFLMTWYAQLSLPRLDPYSANDQELQLMIERVRAVAGYDINFYNSTMENGIPSILAIAKNRKQKGLNLICAAGAHLDPLKAVKSAIHELAAMMMTLDEKFEENQEELLRMLQEPSLVRKMDDHGLLYGMPQAEDRLQFLLNENRPLRTFDEEYKWKSNHTDLTEDLQEILSVFRKLNLDVIVVDQTTSETIRNGLHCVKVLIPGMLPMTFGQHLTRVTGLERVLKVPMNLGYSSQPLKFEELNPHPHPFP
jgi:ribosomal protein S12 methylthiotransferase accessory factor